MKLAATNSRNIHPLNGSDRAWARHRYILAFGEPGSTRPARLMVWANSLERALDDAADWLAENAPGLLCDAEVSEAYEAAKAAGMSEDEACEESLVDVTVAGSGGHFIHSEWWTVVATDPTRAEILALQGR